MAVPIRVLLVDDERLIRAGLRVILEQPGDLEVVGEAVDGAQAIALVARRRPDVVLMDVRMPVLDGLESARRILAEPLGSIAVIMLTTFDADEHVYAALRAGASGFLLKDTPEDQLIAAIRVVAAGEAIMAPTVTRRLIQRFAAEEEERADGPVRERHAAALQQLTDREREVLAEVARGRSNAEIAAALVVSGHTVKTHVARLLMKLGLRDRVQLAIFAYESGFVVRGDDGRDGKVARRSDVRPGTPSVASPP